MANLVTTSDVKLYLGITDSSQDSLISAIVAGVSGQVEAYLDRSLQRTTYSSEVYAINQRQLLLLNQWPIQLVSSITVNGTALTQNVDYEIQPYDQKMGVIFKGTGFLGPFWITDLTADPVSGYRNIVVSYVAGYYLPGDVGYVAGAAASLPLEISYVAGQLACLEYQKIKRQAQGLKSISEGGLSYSWATSGESNNLAGLPQEYAAILNRYKRWSIA